MRRQNINLSYSKWPLLCWDPWLSLNRHSLQMLLECAKMFARKTFRYYSFVGQLTAAGASNCLVATEVSKQQCSVLADINCQALHVPFGHASCESTHIGRRSVTRSVSLEGPFICLSGASESCPPLNRTCPIQIPPSERSSESDDPSESDGGLSESDGGLSESDRLV